MYSAAGNQSDRFNNVVVGKPPSWMNVKKSSSSVPLEGGSEKSCSEISSLSSANTSVSATSNMTDSSSSLYEALGVEPRLQCTPRRLGSDVWSDTSSLISSLTSGSNSSSSKSAASSEGGSYRFDSMFSPKGSSVFYSPHERLLSGVGSKCTPTLNSRARNSSQHGGHYTSAISQISSLASESVLVSIRQSAAMRDLCKMVLGDVESRVKDVSLYKDKTIGVLVIKNRLVLTVSGSDEARERVQMKYVLSDVSDAISDLKEGQRLISDASIKRVSIRSRADRGVEKYVFPSLSDLADIASEIAVSASTKRLGSSNLDQQEEVLSVVESPKRVLNSGVAQKASNQFLDFLLGQLHHDYQSADPERKGKLGETDSEDGD